MSEDANIIREFLVGLGFKIDEAGNKKFTDSITKGTKDALEFGGAVIGTATALAVLTDKLAGSVESLYFMSQRTGAAIANIKGAGYAATQLGSSAESAYGALENMGEFLRNNPGSEGYLNSLKVQTRDANGALMDTGKIMVGLGHQLSQMPNYQAKAFGDFFHIDDKTLLALKSGDFERLMEDHNRRLQEAGVDMADLGVQSHEYELAWRQLNDEVGVFADKRLAAILPMMTSIVHETESWLEDITSAGTKLDQIRAKKYTGVGDYIDKRGIGGALWDSLVAGTSFVGSGLVNTGKVIKIGGESMLGAKGAADQDIYDLTGGLGGKNTRSAQTAVESDKQKTALNTLTGMGWTQQQAAGILANLKAESGMNPNAVGDNGQAYGLAQWHPDRQADFKRIMGHDIRQSTADEQMRFLNWELNNTEAAAGNAIRGSTTAAQAGAAGVMFERPADFAGQARLRSESADSIYRQAVTQNITVSPNTTINVTGGENPQATADAIEHRQRSINQDVTRNVASVIQ